MTTVTVGTAATVGTVVTVVTEVREEKTHFCKISIRCNINVYLSWNGDIYGRYINTNCSPN